MIEYDKYKNYKTDDFVWDEKFREWVLMSTPALTLFWTEYLILHPEQEESTAAAKEIILRLKVKEPIMGNFEQASILNAVNNAINSPEVTPKKEKVNSWLFVKVAAILIVFLAIGLKFWPSSPLKEDLRSSYDELVGMSSNRLIEKVNTSSEPMKIVLEDKSEVVLEKGAKISYTPSFQGTELREVYLSGDAFFNVAKNSLKPFMVYSNGLITKVLGTSFKISSKKIEDDVTVEVISGVVSVYSLKDKKSTSVSGKGKVGGFILMRNQKVNYSSKDNSLLASVVDNPAPAEGLEVDYDFVDYPITSVIDLIEKDYGIEIVYDDVLLKDRTITADISGITMYQKLTIICKVINSRYEMIDGKIVIIK